MRSKTLEYFTALGERIERRFHDAEYLEEALTDIAMEELERTPAHMSAQPLDVLSEAARGGLLPPQFSSDMSFGQPPITVFSGARFVIDVYFWFEGTTSTHQHGFCGAFQVFAGSSLHATRRFQCERRVNARFLLGRVETSLCEVLHVGNTRAILAGDAFAHSLFHLDHPSATVVVRTRVSPGTDPQYNYAVPFVAYDPFHRPFARLLQLESLNALFQASKERYAEALREALATATIENTFFILQREAMREADKLPSDNECYQSALTLAVERHGHETIHKLAACIAHGHRAEDVVMGRNFTSHPDERFLLATLLNSHSREQVLDFTRSRYPQQDPVEAFMALFERMAQSTANGAENALGFELGTEAVLLVRMMLSGIANEDVPAKLLEAGYQQDRVAAKEKEILTFYANLRSTTVLSVLAQ